MTSSGRVRPQPSEIGPTSAIPIEGDLHEALEAFKRSLDPERYPAMLAHVEWHQTGPGAAYELEFVLDLILDGLET